MASAVDSGSNGSHCVVFLGKTLYSHSILSPDPGV